MPEHPPTVATPTRNDIREMAGELNLELTAREIDTFHGLLTEKIKVYEQIAELPEPNGSASYDKRRTVDSSTEDRDPHNAFVNRCHVEGADSGPLANSKIAVKDNISVADVPLTCGSAVFEGYRPKKDAIAVNRMLDSGGTIVGKTNLDEMGVSGSGEVSRFGLIRNPRDTEYLAGGSSGGSAVAVVRGDADISLGTDQAGSLRIPASWSGCVGHKPTYGLVPYTGCVPLGPTIDHVGPMASRVETCALALEELAGCHPDDPRTRAAPSELSIVNTLHDGIEDVTIGILREGFVDDWIERTVDESVRRSINRFKELGADVRKISIPSHTDGFLIWAGVVWEETARILQDSGLGYYQDGFYPTDYLLEFVDRINNKIDQFAPTVKLSMLLGQYVQQQSFGYFHAKAQNLRQELRRSYDEAFNDVDILALPTTPTTAFKVRENLSTSELVNRAQGKEGRARNTTPFNMSGHPSLSLPCEIVDGLPIGLMLVGRRYDDATILRAAQAYQSAYGPYM